MKSLAEVLEMAGWRTFHVDGKKVQDKATFLAAIASALQFPSWFGGNWDALEECLDDLSWAQARGYVLVLEGMEPFARAAPADWQVACDVLAEAAARWGRRNVPFHVLTRLA